mgnify:CR=1 FL=1
MVSALVLQFQQLALFLGGPFVPPDGPVEVVVIALPALLAIAMIDAVLFFKKPRNLGPFFDSSNLIELF